MRYLTLLIFVVCLSCNQQGMTDEHRQKLKQEAADRKIVRVTDADILTAAKEMASGIFEQRQGDSTKRDNVKWISLQDSTLSAYERQMQEAYQYALDQGLDLYDNIEDTEDGMIIFTKPDISPDSIHGFWVITLDKKEVIKALQ